jgi:anti-sigma regulatory factor (Ser/Thr protein kinase)
MSGTGSEAPHCTADAGHSTPLQKSCCSAFRYPGRGYLGPVPGDDLLGERTQSRHRSLPPEPPSVREARELVRSACSSWGVREHASDDAALVVTELVSNVVDHAHTPCHVAVSQNDSGLLIEVDDFNAHAMPHTAPLDLTARRGHGLRVIAGLSTSWGVTRHAIGKRVWAVVPTKG